MNDIILWLLDVVQSVDPVLRTALAGFGILLETSVLVGLVVPGDTIVIIAATAVESPVQFVALVLAVISGALIGESIGFALGRFFGPRIRMSRLGRWLGERNWVRAETFLKRRGGVAVFISRFLPVLHSLIPLTVGMSPKARTFRSDATAGSSACFQAPEATTGPAPASVATDWTPLRLLRHRLRRDSGRFRDESDRGRGHALHPSVALDAIMMG